MFSSSALHIMFPLTTLPLYMTPSLSLSASASKLKVDFICPITSQLLSLSSSCHAVLCGSDNGSNYTGSMSVPHHSSKDRLWQHDAHCWLATFSTRSGESQWKGLYAVTRKSRHCSFGFVKRANQICKEVIKKPVDIYVLWFLSRVHSASVLPTSNMLCGFSKICWDPVLWRCWDKLPMGKHTAALLTLT